MNDCKCGHSVHSHQPGSKGILECTICTCYGYYSSEPTSQANPKPLFSPLTLEVKIRYAAAFLFLAFFVMLQFSFDPFDIGIFTDLNGVVFTYGLYPFITLLLWSLFNRWYFMISAMAVLINVIFATMVIGVPVALLIEALALLSFVMYVDRCRQDKNKEPITKQSTQFYLGIAWVVVSVAGFMFLMYGTFIDDQIKLYQYDAEFRDHKIVDAFNSKYDQYHSFEPSRTPNTFIQYMFLSPDSSVYVSLIIKQGPESEPAMSIKCGTDLVITENLLEYIEKYDCFTDMYP